MTKKEIRNFLHNHPPKEFSAARLEYSIYLTPGMEEAVNQYVAEHLVPTDKDIKREQEIIAAETMDELIRLMRKPLSGANRVLLRKKILQYENEILPLIQSRAMTNMQDIFIENTLHFFLYTQNNYCDWIVQNYKAMKSEYLKSMLCLVLGFRGEVSLIPFLMAETERLEREYPFESFGQGPLLAVEELATRHMGYSQ